MKITIPISLGELYDKLSILEIKIANMDSPQKIANVSKEYKLLREIAEQYPIDEDFYVRLRKVNAHIWNIEDDIRKKEKDLKFDDFFIHLARSVYVSNDERSKIKKEINELYGSDIIEEKSYKEYK